MLIEARQREASFLGGESCDPIGEVGVAPGPALLLEAHPGVFDQGSSQGLGFFDLPEEDGELGEARIS